MGKSILVADSDGASLDLLDRLLKIFGYEEVIKAEDGLEALYLATQKMPDLVVVDANLPKLDGFLLCEIFHNVAKYRDMAVVLMSAGMNTQTMEKGMLAGAYAFLEKPLTPEGVKNILGSRAAQQNKFPEAMSKPVQALVSQFSEETKRMLNLCFGQPAKVLKTESQSPELVAKPFDVLAKATLDGKSKITLALGVSSEVAKAIAQGLGKKDLSQTGLGQALGGLLSSIIDRSLARVNETQAVKSGSVQVIFSAPLQLEANVKERYGVQLRVAMQSAILRKQLGLTLLIAMHP